MPGWLTYLDLACATTAAGLWYASSRWEPLLLALAPWVIRFALTRRLTRRTPFDLPLALFLLTAGVGVWVAYDRAAAWARFWLILGGVLFFYALANAEPAGDLADPSLRARYCYYPALRGAPSRGSYSRRSNLPSAGGDCFGPPKRMARPRNDETSSSDVRAWLLACIGAAVATVFVLTNDWAASAKISLLARLGQALQAPLPHLPGPGANANIVGAILATLLPFAGLAALQAWRRWRSARGPALSLPAFVLALLLLLLVAFGWVMAASRAAWAAVLGALFLAAAWLVAGRLGRGSPANLAHPAKPCQERRAEYRNAGRSTESTRRSPANCAGCSSDSGNAGRSTNPVRQIRIPKRGYGVPIFAVWLGLGLVAIGVVVTTRPAMIAALLDALPGPSAAGSRIELWRNGLTLARDYPFTGLGLDGFMMAYSTYSMLLHVGFAQHAHNLYLDLALGQGLPALLILLWMGALFFRELWRDRSRPDAPQRSGLGAAALSLLVILLHGLVDDPLYANRAVLLFFVPLAFASRKGDTEYLSALPQAPDTGLQPTRRAVSAVLPIAVLALVAVALLWRVSLLSQVASNVGAVYQTRIELAEYRWPEWPIQDELRRQVDLTPAVAEFERALALDPGNASANRRLGQIELSLGQYGAALGHLRAAYAAEPWSTTTRQLLGEAYLANGEREVGRALWAGVSNEQRQLDIRAWWYDHIGDAERAEWMRWAAVAGSQ